MSTLNRVYTDYESWKDNIRKEMISSKAIIILIRDTESVRWEVETIFEMNCEFKTLFLFKNSLSVNSMRDFFDYLDSSTVGFFYLKEERIIFHKGVLDDKINSCLILRSFLRKVEENW